MATEKQKATQFKRIGQIKEYDPQLISNEKALRERVRKLASVANTRITRLRSRSDVSQEAIRFREQLVEEGKAKGVRFATPASIKKMNMNELRREYSQLVKFINRGDSTIAGAKAKLTKQDEFLREIGIDPVIYDNDKKNEFFDLYHKLIEARGDNFTYGGRGDHSAIKAFARLWKSNSFPVIKEKAVRSRKYKRSKTEDVITSDFGGEVDLTKLGRMIELLTEIEVAKSSREDESLIDEFEKELLGIDIFK